MSESAAPFPAEPATTGLPVVDEALARLADLDDRPVSEHHEPLAAAHDALHTELQPPTGRVDD